METKILEGDPCLVTEKGRRLAAMAVYSATVRVSDLIDALRFTFSVPSREVFTRLPVSIVHQDTKNLLLLGKSGIAVQTTLWSDSGSASFVTVRSNPITVYNADAFDFISRRVTNIEQPETAGIIDSLGNLAAKGVAEVDLVFDDRPEMLIASKGDVVLRCGRAEPFPYLYDTKADKVNRQWYTLDVMVFPQDLLDALTFMSDEIGNGWTYNNRAYATAKIRVDQDQMTLGLINPATQGTLLDSSCKIPCSSASSRTPCDFYVSVAAAKFAMSQIRKLHVSQVRLVANPPLEPRADRRSNNFRILFVTEGISGEFIL